MRELQLIVVVRYPELPRELRDIHQHLIVGRFIRRVVELASATAL